ncbi:DUF3703 domain-containing protein [Sphaerotilaceae bacterium SBD11-9]
MSSPRITAFDAALAESAQRLRVGEHEAAFALLERAHVLGQFDLGRHFQVHGRMLRVAWLQRDAHEVMGQVFRLALVPIGHLVGRLPRGNIGRATVSAFQPMPIAPDVDALLRSDKAVTPGPRSPT